MVKNNIHKAVSFFMALLVMVSTMSVTIEKHFCGDVLVDVSVFADAKKCGMETQETTIADLARKSCCKDTVDVLEGQDKLSLKTFEDIDLDQKHLLVAFSYADANLFESLPQHIIPHQYYDPPNLIFDIQVLDEVYLI